MEKVAKITALDVASGSHEGMSGKHNEDSLGVFAWKLDSQRVMHVGVVADGVGGQIAGEVASKLTIAGVENYFNNQEQVNNISGHLEQAIRAANEAVYHASQENPEYRGMSTTIAIAAIADGQLYTAHVGDSRIYLWRDGQLRQISTDHTWAQEAIEAGLLTREQAKTHPNRNVIKRHLGGNLQIEVDHRLVLTPGQTADEAHSNQGMPLKAGDLILICSDGLTDMISDESVYESLQRHMSDLDTAVEELIDKANQAGGRDNITVVLLKVPGQSGAAAAATIAAASTLVEPTLVAAAPGSTPTVAGAPPKTAPKVVSTAKTSEARTRLGWPLLLGGGAVIALIVIAVIAALVILRSAGDESATETPTLTAPASGTPEATRTVGSPATAAILTRDSGVAGTPDVAGSGTPGPTPTLGSTNTPTPRPTIRPSATPPLDLGPTATIPPTFTAASQEPQPTDPPPPTNPPLPTSTVPRPTSDPGSGGIDG